MKKKCELLYTKYDKYEYEIKKNIGGLLGE